ncbi:B-cell lymphoma 3 protein homolog [Ceratina calcarata]|nr:B-cell lymphoma 3 protein homolog [Ceratina calcarata]
MQSWDDDGFFNIHRAVMNDDFRRVKRLMVVLNASKTNIDIRTEDGLTSLELAVKYCSSESIVKLLLDAGAKPITSELLHESAVILASKSSSPLLPLLLDYVTESELLNQMDSTGFAPLHYCAMHGNMNGLTSLISKGVDVNVRDHRSGRTPFFHAVENNHMKIAQKLIQSGGIADIPNFSGQSVMSLVCEAKRFLLMPVLRDMIFQLPASKNRSNF